MWRCKTQDNTGIELKHDSFVDPNSHWLTGSEPYGKPPLCCGENRNISLVSNIICGNETQKDSCNLVKINYYYYYYKPSQMWGSYDVASVSCNKGALSVHPFKHWYLFHTILDEILSSKTDWTILLTANWNTVKHQKILSDHHLGNGTENEICCWMITSKASE